MQSIATDGGVALSVCMCVCVSVCLLVTWRSILTDPEIGLGATFGVGFSIQKASRGCGVVRVYPLPS